MENWFSGCNSLDAAKARYKELVKRYHPDLHPEVGDETIQQINAQYDRIVEKLSRVSSDGRTEATEQERKNAQETAEEYRAVILSIINLEGIEIEMCGSWLWVSGNTYFHKEALKRAGFCWSAKKKLWYWRPESQSCAGNRKSHSMGYIRLRYGSAKIVNDGENGRCAIAD